MLLKTKKLRLKPRRKHVKRFMTILAVVAAITAVSVFAWLYIDNNTLENKAKSVADSFVRALEAKDINGAVKLSGKTQQASYYNQIALQLGSNYKIIKSTSKDNENNTLYSFIYKAESPRRPGTTFLRVVVEKMKDKLTVQSVFPNATEPSTFPS